VTGNAVNCGRTKVPVKISRSKAGIALSFFQPNPKTNIRLATKKNVRPVKNNVLPVPKLGKKKRDEIGEIKDKQINTNERNINIKNNILQNLRCQVLRTAW
jgi:hypothetical protein